VNDINELVDLPDPTTHPLVHPLDLPEARRPFRISWLIGALTGPPVAALAAVILWFASHNYLVPLIAGAAILGFGQLASRQYRDKAWAFIPRKRQDRRRPLYPLPAVVAVAGSLVVACRILFGASAPDSPATLLWGAATMLAGGAGVGVWKLVEARRTARPRDGAHGG
jgi:hypothetical protein